MEYRDAVLSDFDSVESFVRSCIYPAYYHAELSEEQQLENQWIIDVSRESCVEALANDQKLLRVAYSNDALAGFVLADRSALEYPEIDWLMVAPEFHGMGVAQRLMGEALEWIGPDYGVKLGVIHYNTRAIQFYAKCGFEDTGKVFGQYKIPRKYLLKPAVVSAKPCELIEQQGRALTNSSL